MTLSTTIPLLVSALLAAVARSQALGTQIKERHPNITWETCTTAAGCVSKQSRLTLDANWRWYHAKEEPYTNCLVGRENTWNTTLCPDTTTCASNCVLDGEADYAPRYAITGTDSTLSLKYLAYGGWSGNKGSRSFLLDDNDEYVLFRLEPGTEFAFDVRATSLGCGVNGALHFVGMDKDGGRARYGGNEVGAKYGTGYCDAGCGLGNKFVGGKPNVDGWIPSSTDPQNGEGNMGSCCAELNIWDANSMATALSAKPCSIDEQEVCYGDGCPSAPYNEVRTPPCEDVGCVLNPYQLGNREFYGRGESASGNGTRGVDTTQPFTVVTQFLGDGAQLEIKRFYIQNGTRIPSPESRISGLEGSSLTENFCEQQVSAFEDMAWSSSRFKDVGGMESMSRAMKKGMVLAFSILDDHYSHMLWLDSTYPTDLDPSVPGVARGACGIETGEPKDFSLMGDARVWFSNIRFGELDSTYAVEGEA